ncbi:toll-like receptor 4 [Haliotis rubra]|uniref:toll-like receptor 4 n=1 Tax=Haliotis rubra TaxID=36100 RepID=UPI001EE59888|nr:toll-like receptor 4 [Haliotis rubra]
MAGVQKLMWVAFLLHSGAAAVGGERGDLDSCEPCTCSHTHVNCSSRHLTTVPKTLPKGIQTLDLAHNSIHELIKTSFDSYGDLTALNISYNKLRFLDRDVFQHLIRLQTLDLQHNQMPLSDRSYPVGLFRNQKMLRQLFLQSNTDCNSGYNYPDTVFSDLTNLTELHIDGLQNFVFGKGFKNLTKLTSLLLEGTCDIGTVRNDSFTYLPSVQSLSLVNCGIIYVEHSSFSPLSNNIRYLDVSDNVDLGLIRFGQAMYGLRNKTVRILKANRLHRHRGTGIALECKDFASLKYITLEELHIDDNRIEVLDMGITGLLSHLKRLSGRKNLYLFGPYVLTGQALTKIEWADLSGQGASTADLFRRNANNMHLQKLRTEPTCFTSDEIEQISGISHETVAHVARKRWDSIPNLIQSGCLFHLPQKLTFANFSRSKFNLHIRNVRFCNSNLTKLDLSHNLFTKWEGPIRGFGSLEYLDLSHNFCDYVNNSLFKSVSRLKTLKLGTNFLGFPMKDLQFNLSTLEHLDLTDNKIQDLTISNFILLRSLKYLDLSYNDLVSWNATIENMHNLTTLNISHNLFVDFPISLASQIDQLNSKHLRVDFQGNSLQCNCLTLKSLQWINKNSNRFVNMQGLECTFNDKNINLTNIRNIVLQLEKTCASYVGLMIGILTIVMLVMALSIAGVLFRYRWKLRYLYYVMRNRHRGYLPAQDVDHEFEFDAFISYADEDRGFVVREMREVLEDQDDMSLCIHHRDFLPGEAIAANILKAISTSRKTVVILTRNFLKSHWCRYELEMAKMESIYAGRNTLLIVLMEDIPVKDLPVDIVEVMRKDSYVEFTDDTEGRDVFWHSLKRGLRA